MTSPIPPGEIDRRLRELLAPSGDAAYRHLRGEALAYLLAPQHADEAHDRLLELANAPSPSVHALLALPRFGRAESVPVLEQVLRSAPDPTTVIAAQALAEHPDPAARTVLERALGDERDQVVASAADGLAERGDKASCAALSSALAHRNADVGERVRQAMRRLDCGDVRQCST
jgi:HEAT repeat protein